MHGEEEATNVDKVNNNEGDKKVEECSGVFAGAEIPVDKENPLKCVECDEVFENHFGLKQHYQNDHLKLLHKCNVEGCNAGFPSKRSRDRHSSNLNLHRKLLSCTGGKEDSAPSPLTGSAEGDVSRGVPAAFSVNSLASPYTNPNDLLARLYAEQQALLFSQMNGSPADFHKMASAVMMGPPPPFPTAAAADSAGGSASPTSSHSPSMPNSPELKVKPLGMLTEAIAKEGLSSS